MSRLPKARKSQRIQDDHPEPTGQRLILLIDQDSHLINKEIYTGTSQGNVGVLRDPGVRHSREKSLYRAQHPQSLSLRGKGRAGDISIKPTSADRGSPLEGT
jgi:hypothetical protein